MAHTQPRALPGGANWAGGYTSPEEVAKKILADREIANAQTKLTWNPDRPPLAPIDRVVGQVVLVDKEKNRYEVRGVNLALPYMRLGTGAYGRNYYYIQNAMIFDSAGNEVTLDQVQATVDPDTFDMVSGAYAVFIKDAAKRDDALCKICVKYRSRDHEDYLRHMISEHPDHVAKYLGGPAPLPEPVAAVEFQTPPAAGLACCGKTFKDRRGLVGHTRFKHSDKRA